MRFRYIKKIMLTITFIVPVAIMIFSTTSSANYWSGNRPSGVFYAYYSPSVSSYGYTSHFDSARSNWAGISSKVAVNKSGSSSGTPDKYYVGTTSSATLLGQMLPYVQSGSTYVEGNVNSPWAYATVSLYHDTMQSNNMNYSQIVSNATHEIGHTLSLAHTTGTSSSSVMFQGIQGIGPQTYDKGQLKAKWGN